MLLVLIITIALMSICHMPNNLICLYNDNELNALTHIFIGFMSNTKVTLSEFLFELKLNFHIISSPKQFSRGLQMFISIHTRMKFLEDGASGSIKIKYASSHKKNEIFSRWNFRFHQNQIRLKVVKK